MFSNFAWSEMLVIACVAIIVIGPKDLPAMLRQFGKAVGTMKRMAGDFQRQFNDAIKDTELDELRDMTSTKGFGPLEDARKTMEDLQNSIGDSVDLEPEVEAPAVEKPQPKAATKAKAATTKSTTKKSPTTKKSSVAKKPTAKKSAASKPRATKSTASAKMNS